jgi:putative ABC transport system permease protein
MDQLISKRTADQHFIVVLLISFASLAVVLAAVGLYGVVSYSTAQRTSEFGVRLALGAQAQDLVQSVLLEGLKPALIGMGMGLIASLGAGRIMRSMLFEVKPFDAAVFALVACGLLLVSVAASLIPALRTTVIDPAQALRGE